MKKLFIALAMSSLFTGSSFALDGDGVVVVDDSGAIEPSRSSSVTFTGKIVNETCFISTESDGLTVKLPILTVSDLKGGNEGEQVFDITLDNCQQSNNTVASLFFKADASKLEGHVLKNSLSTDAAENVGIELSTDVGEIIKLGISQPFYQDVPEQTINSNTLTYQFVARYKKLNDSADITGGKVSATLPFQIIYK